MKNLENCISPLERARNPVSFKEIKMLRVPKKCANFHRCRGDGHINGKLKHYLTEYCPYEIENSGESSTSESSTSESVETSSKVSNTSELRDIVNRNDKPFSEEIDDVASNRNAQPIPLPRPQPFPELQNIESGEMLEAVPRPQDKTAQKSTRNRNESNNLKTYLYYFNLY
jgi:hypothetical protein